MITHSPVCTIEDNVWIHLGILRTRGGELVASCNLLYCLVASDASCGTLLGALVLERRYRSCCWTDRDQPPFIGCGTDGCIKYLQCATQACRHVLCTAVGGQSQSQIRRLSGSVLAIWDACGIMQSGRQVVQVSRRRPSRAVSWSSVGH